MKILITILSICLIGIAQCQQNFFNVYGGTGSDYGESVVSSLDTGYTVLGASESFGFGGLDMYIFHVDSTGAVQWSNHFGGNNVDWGKDIIQDSNGDYICVGYSNSFSVGYDGFMVRTTNQGIPIWTKTLGGDSWDFLNEVIELSDGSFLAVGETQSNSNGPSDAWVVNFDENGDTLWTKTFGGSGKDYFSYVIETFHNELIFVGSTNTGTSHGDFDIWTVKTDFSCNEIWEKTYGDTLDDFGRTAINMLDSNYTITGAWNTDTAGVNYFYEKIDTAGNDIYTFNWDNDGDEELAYTVRYANDYRVFLGGSATPPGGGTYDIYRGAFSINGWPDNGWFGLTGVQGDDFAHGADTTFDKGLIIVGTTLTSTNGIASVILTKLDSLNTPTSLTYQELNAVGIDELIDNQISVYPNPCTNILKIEGIASNNKEYIIYDAIGKQVQSGRINLGTIDTKELPSGNYILSIPEFGVNAKLLKL